ncbi:hypothetical protein SPHINGOAX6_50281 [Sphingomonas sp. AX6]|nr:hypothetical protein SPHINGOAX6_50281 [Sphingomonas sp. AX6]
MEARLCSGQRGRGCVSQMEWFRERSILPSPDLGHRARKFLEIACFGEILIDAREADIGDRVQPLQRLHHHLADTVGGDFAFALCFQLTLDAGHQLVDPCLVDRALSAGDRHRAEQFFALERFAAVFGFQDGQFAQLNALERGEARAACFALAAAADGRAVFCGAAVLYLAVFMGAEGAAHILIKSVRPE